MQVIFQRYLKAIEKVQQHFETCKASQKLPRNAPPVAGHILWARQLLMQIELPMKEYVFWPVLMSICDRSRQTCKYEGRNGCRFCHYQTLVESPEGQRVVLLYNRTVKTLIEYEVLWTASWLGTVHQAYTKISAPILCRDPTSGQIHSLSLHLFPPAHCHIGPSCGHRATL